VKISSQKAPAAKPAKKTGLFRESMQNIRAACSTEKARRIQFAFVILLFFAAIGGIAFGAFKLYQTLFVTNPRLQLQRVEVCSQTGGYWQQHQTELIQKIGLQTGMSFHDIHPDEIRQKLLAIPNISAATVEVLHPDAIRLNITERIPVAQLDTTWVIDSEGYILRRSETIANQLPLPVIIESQRKAYQEHTQRKELRCAIQLTAAMQNYPNIQMPQLIVRSDSKLVARVNYMGENCSITFPDGKEEKDYRFLIERFLDALVQSRLKGDMRKNFDMSFEGRVVVK